MQVRSWCVLFLALSITACTLPRGAALQSEVLRNQSADAPEFAVYPLNEAIIPIVANWPATGNATVYDWVPKYRGPIGRVLLPGDVVSISIWDNDVNSLLTSDVEKVAKLQPMVVAPNGNVFVPYLGEVAVGGMTESNARVMVQEALAAVSPSAQVQLTSKPGRRHSVDLVSGITRPGSYPLEERDMTVLSAVSLGGGVDPKLNNPQVRLLRDSKTYGIPLDRLVENPLLDTTLRQGDKIVVEQDENYFLALGASGQEALIPFPKDSVSALDAMSLMSGLSDTRANPRGILIMREYNGTAVKPTLAKGPAQKRVVFTVDLTSADGLFSAGKFDVMPKDLVYATESSVSNVRTVLGLIGSVVGIADRIDDN